MQTEWQNQNRAAIARRMQPACALRDGLLEAGRAGTLLVEIHKQACQIALYFRDPHGAELDGPMSRIACDRPLELLGEYTQAVLLALIWVGAPRHVCMLGFGGGRLSLALHHAFPEAQIDNVDIDPLFSALAERYFGIAFDERQHYYVGDARAFLEQAHAPVYDLIVMDAFSDQHDELDHLATAEYYEALRRRLTRSGVAAVNFLRSDSHFAEKTWTFTRAFAHVALAPLKYSVVMFGSVQHQLDVGQAGQRVAELERRYDLEASLGERVRNLISYRGSDLADLHRSLRPELMRDAL